MAQADFNGSTSTNGDPIQPVTILNRLRVAVSRRSAVKALAAALAVGSVVSVASASAHPVPNLTPEAYLAMMREFGCECFSLVFVKRDGSEGAIVGVTEYGEAFRDNRDWPGEKVAQWGRFRKAAFDMGPKLIEKVGAHLYDVGRREYCGPGAMSYEAPDRLYST